MLKSNKESSKKYDNFLMTAYMVYEDFELSELIPISMLNTKIHCTIFRGLPCIRWILFLGFFYQLFLLIFIHY